MKPLLCITCVLVCLVFVSGFTVEAQEKKKKTPSHTTLHTIESKIVQREVKFFIFLPPEYNADQKRHFPTVYHLHHNGGDHYAFFNWLRIRDQTNKKTGAVIPGIDGGKWLYEMMKADKIIPAIYVVPKSPYNAWDKKMGQVLVEEILPYVEDNYKTIKNRRQRMVQGISMGGAGALLYGPTYPKTFGAVQSVIGYAPAKEKWKELASGYRQLRIRMDQGSHDTFGGAVNNTEFALFLAQQKIGFQLEMYQNYEHHASRIMGFGGDRIFAFQKEFFSQRQRPDIRNRSAVNRMIKNNAMSDTAE